MFNLKQVSLVKKQRTLLQIDSLTFASGALTAVIGANGAGKSTLMRALLDPDSLSSGSVSLAERPLNSFSLVELSRRRAYVEQAARPTFSLEVIEYLRLARSQFTESSKQRDRCIADVIGRLNMSRLLVRDITTLSGGEFQLVEYARALIQLTQGADYEHCTLLLDEPCSALDIRQSQILYSHLREFIELGGSAILVEHNINEAARISDFVLFLSGGRVFAHGPTKTVFTTPNINTCFATEGTVLSHAVQGGQDTRLIYQSLIN